MSTSYDLLPKIRILSSEEEMVGKRVVSVGGPNLLHRDLMIVFEDQTAILLYADQDEADAYVLVHPEPSPRDLAWIYRKMNLIDAETYERFWSLHQEEVEAAELAAERKEYKRLKAKFEPEK